MMQIKLSGYMNAGKDMDIEYALKADMERLDALKQNWSILIDVDWIGIGFWTLFIKETGKIYADYEYLESIDVASNIKNYKSVNGCLIDKDDKLRFDLSR